MNHIKETEKFFNSIKGGYRPNPEDEAEVHALIAIAEQLRLANLITLATSNLMLSRVAIDALEETNHVWTQPIETGSLKPDIAEALGIKEEA